MPSAAIATTRHQRDTSPAPETTGLGRTPRLFRATSAAKPNRNHGNGTFTLKITDAYKQQTQQEVVNQSIEVVRRRIDEMGTREPAIYDRLMGDDELASLVGAQIVISGEVGGLGESRVVYLAATANGKELRSTTLAVGSKDEVAGSAQALAALLPRGRALDIPGRDHMLAVGDKAFKEAALAFLAEQT